METIKIALIGFGTVGRAFYKQVNQITCFEIKHVIAKNAKKHKNDHLQIDISYDINIALNDPEISIVVEVIDDVGVALEVAIRTLKSGKTFLTANKKMVAENLAELVETAKKYRASFYYEAAVAAAIPILVSLRDHFQFEPIQSIRGIVNGSCNYILSAMTNDGLGFNEALNQAQALGYAETDPTLDIEAYDSMYKTAILAHQAFNKIVPLDEILRVGITEITPKDILSARKAGKKFKLVIKLQFDGEDLTASVLPQLVGPDDALFHIDGVNNALVVEGKNCGEVVLTGPGAGGAPTASALVGDLSTILTAYKTMATLVH